MLPEDGPDTDYQEITEAAGAGGEEEFAARGDETALLPDGNGQEAVMYADIKDRYSFQFYMFGLYRP